MAPFRRLPLLILAALLTACGDDSTGPGVDLAFAATRFDALGRDRATAGDHGGAMAARGAAIALRLGVRPTRVSIAVDGVTEDYLALEMERAFGIPGTDVLLPAPPLVVRTMIAWRGVRPERVLSITVSGDTGTFEPPCIACLSETSSLVYWPHGIMFERGSPLWIAFAGGARTTQQSIGAECELPKRSVFVPGLMPGLEPIACHRAVFLTRFTMTANETGTTWIRSRVVQMGAHDVAGVRLQYGPLVP